MAVGWTADETITPIAAWGETHVQEQLDSVKRNRDIYEAIARVLAEQGYNKTWKQCRVNMLTQRYRKVCLPFITSASCSYGKVKQSALQVHTHAFLRRVGVASR